MAAMLHRVQPTQSEILRFLLIYRALVCLRLPLFLPERSASVVLNVFTLFNVISSPMFLVMSIAYFLSVFTDFGSCNSYSPPRWHSIRSCSPAFTLTPHTPYFAFLSSQWCRKSIKNRILAQYLHGNLSERFAVKGNNLLCSEPWKTVLKAYKIYISCG